MRSKFKLIMMFVMSALLFAACNTPAAEPKAIDLDKTKTQIQAMEDAFAAGEKAKDVNAVAAYYSNDAISYGRNVEPFKGIDAIKKHIADDIAKDSTGNHNVYKVVDLFGEGNMVVEIGSWSKIDPTGKEIDKGHYMSYFQKQSDSTYKCMRDMSVTSTPAKKPM
ncbi:MAG: nuclear transport factor 2 family protein [Bacteroidota bacterium]|nr:nuclear transport factor 2 family protein [Bacteroidota bacterium]